MNKTRERSGSLFERLDAAASFMLANLLFVVCSIPLVTLPASAAGLFAVTSKWARGESAEVFADFFGGMRQHWRRATPVGLADAVLLGLAAINFTVFPRMGLPPTVALVGQSATLFVALATLMTNLYFWPLLVSFDMPLRDLVKLSARLAFVHPAWSGLVLLGLLAIALASLILPVAALVIATFAGIALLTNLGAWRIIRRYVTTNAPDEPESMP